MEGNRLMLSSAVQIPQQIAQHLRDVHFGGNWTVSCMKDLLDGLTWQEATQKVQSFNTIAVLAYHTHYFVKAANEVLQGLPLNAHDQFSFDCPPIENQEDWENLKNKIWEEAKSLATLIEQLPADQLGEVFVEAKYGTYFRNLSGIIEHTHYHLGQIALLRKLVTATS